MKEWREWQNGKNASELGETPELGELDAEAKDMDGHDKGGDMMSTKDMGAKNMVVNGVDRNDMAEKDMAGKDIAKKDVGRKAADGKSSGRKESNEGLSFEQKLDKLEEISNTLQDPSTDLLKAVDLYEEGMKLASAIDKELSGIERRIEIVTSKPGENPTGVMTQEYGDSWADF